MRPVVRPAGGNAASGGHENSQNTAEAPVLARSEKLTAAGGRGRARSVAGSGAPAFNAQEKTIITAWSATIQHYGLRTEINSNHAFLAEALHVIAGADDEPSWVVHKTPEGQVAVRMWPGLADIVMTLAEALAIIAAAEAEARRRA
jgi:hypothetical protein